MSFQNIIIGEAIYVHKKLGRDLLESVYENCLYYRLVKTGLNSVRERAIAVVFEEIKN